MLKHTDKIAVKVNRRGRLLAATMAVLVCMAAAGPAVAETRTLKVHFTHTKERAAITFKKNGRYIPAGLKKLNTILRDWRQKEATKMDPRLFDLLWEVYQASGSREYIYVVSAYRSPKTNAMLRKRSRGVAKNSQHTLGKAIDFYLPDVSVKKLRRIGMQFQVGGVGYYPKSGSPFVHLDVGSVRSWPRMSRKELSSVFPNGKTLHLPSDGKPLPGYNQALADYKSRVSAKSIQVAGKRPRRTNTRDDNDTNTSGGGGGNLLAGLFNRNQESEQTSFRGGDSETAPRRVQNETQVAAAPARQPRAAVETPAETSVPELAYVPTPQTRPSPPDDIAQIALASATTGPLPVTPAGIDTNGVASNIADQTPAGSELTVATLINTSAAANPAPALANSAPGGQAIPVPRVRAGSSNVKGTRVALARAQGNPPPEVVLGSFLTASAMADPADTPLARGQWGTSQGGADAKNGRLATKVPRPGQRPDVETPDAQVITASLGTDRTQRLTDANGVPVPTRSPLAYSQEPLQVALAPASGGVSATDGGHGFGSFLNSGTVQRAKGARPSAADAAGERRSPMRTEPFVTEHMIKDRALTNVTMTSMSAAVRAPQFVSSYLRQAPNMVHVEGFSLEHGINSADRFSGQAVNFMTVARFDQGNR